MNNVNYFQGCIKLDQVRPRYKELAFMYHPDRGLPTSNTSIMQVINDQYHSILKSFNGTELKNHRTNETYKYQYNWKQEELLREKIDQVISLKLDNITLEVIGSWIWIHKASKEQANLFNRNGLKFKFSGDHLAWYWHKGLLYNYKRQRSGLNLDQIRNIHGSETVDHDRNKQIGQ